MVLVQAVGVYFGVNNDSVITMHWIFPKEHPRALKRHNPTFIGFETL